MKKYLTIFNLQTVGVILISTISSFISVWYHISIYFDFLIIDFIIIFPLTFSLGMAFRRRERAIQYLSLFKSSLQSVYYSFQNGNIDRDKKRQFSQLAGRISSELNKYLSGQSNDAWQVQKAANSIYTFIQVNDDEIKRSFSLKVLLFLFRMNESIEFLLATRRHRTPWGPRAIVLFAIYFFVITYPASVIYDAKTFAGFWYVFFMTASKGLILISFYNVQAALEDPFDQNGPDDIRLDDFIFSPELLPRID